MKLNIFEEENFKINKEKILRTFIMAIISTKAIVLNAIKYGDSSLIVKCYTEKEGIKSYLVRGVLKVKKGKIKPAYFQPLTQLQIIAHHKEKNILHSLREVVVLQQFKTIYKDIVKQAIVLFLSEILVNAIQEEEQNNALFLFIENSIFWLDSNAKISNFHLLFLLKLTYFLGFYPDTSEQQKIGFDLQEGFFTNSIKTHTVIYGTNLIAFKKLLGIDFEAVKKVFFNKQERQVILQIIIQYFELHLSGFKKPKSLPVLEAVFS